jgi:hypothetical protein
MNTSNNHITKQNKTKQFNSKTRKSTVTRLKIMTKQKGDEKGIINNLITYF